jgi:hypothetical protein
MKPLLMLALLAAACDPPRRKDIIVSDPPEGPPITVRFADDFQRAELGPDWYATGGNYQIIDGALSTKGGKNHPLWLRRKLPPAAVIEFDAWSNTTEGDIKVELYGDGRSYDPDEGAYQATGYVLVFGGWKNSKSQIARQDEHGSDVAVEPTGLKVEPRRHYHFRIERRGGLIDWSLDGQPFLRYQDPKPLSGPGNAYFAITNWMADVWFDDLVIAPLGPVR